VCPFCNDQILVTVAYKQNQDKIYGLLLLHVSASTRVMARVNIRARTHTYTHTQTYSGQTYAIGGRFFPDGKRNGYKLW